MIEILAGIFSIGVCLALVLAVILAFSARRDFVRIQREEEKLRDNWRMQFARGLTSKRFHEWYQDLPEMQEGKEVDRE